MRVTVSPQPVARWPQNARQCPGDGATHVGGMGAWGPPAWHVATDRGGMPSGPGPFDHGASGLGVAGGGDRTLPAARTAGRCGGEQAPRVHHVARGLNARQVAEVGHEGHGHGAWYSAPGLDRRSPCLLQALEAFGGLMARAARRLADDRWRWRGTDPCGGSRAGAQRCCAGTGRP